MAVMEILIAPDPRLKGKSLPVDQVDDDVRNLMEDMAETMYAANGIGLAAPQVGVQKRVIVVDVAKSEEESNLIKMANPEVIWESEDLGVYEEGCLSLPEHYSEVERPAEVKIRYLDENNQVQTIEADGLLATCVQHEIDHLEGTLFVDHISSLKRTMILKKLKKLKKTRLAEGAAA